MSPVAGAAVVVPACALLTFAALPPTLRVLRRFGVVDTPNERSSHPLATLRGGGIAPALVAVVALLAFTPGLSPLVVVALSFALIGIVEDVRGVPPMIRLVLHLAVAAAVTPALLASVGDGGIGVLPVVAASIWMVGFVNAFNFMDGINGISSVQAGVTSIVFVVLAVIGDLPLLLVGASVVLGCSLGFAPWNLANPPRVFLGDVGSYFLGGMIAALTVLALGHGIPPEAVLAPSALYVADTSLTLVRRIWRGEPWFRPHRQHVYQRLVAYGLTHRQVSTGLGVLVLAASGLGAVSLGGCIGCRVAADVAIGGLVIAYVAAPAFLASRSARWSLRG